MKHLPPIHRLRVALTMLVTVMLVGAVGFHLLGKAEWLDAFYMAIITLTTVGFREIGLVTTETKVFTMIYLLVGLGTATYAISNLTALIVEGDLQGYLRERRMENRLKDLSEHMIICGFGKVGFQAAWEFKQAGLPFVIIENDENKGRNNPRFSGDIFICGNAMDEMVLERAGVRRAKGLICALTTDADNILVTLTVRNLNADLPVVVRATRIGMESKLKAAGATHIVSPYEIAGHRMANLLMNPEIVRFVDVVLQDRQMELGLERILICPGSELASQTLREARLRDTSGALIVAIDKGSEGFRFNPMGHERFEVGDVILVMGPEKALVEVARMAAAERPNEYCDPDMSAR